MADTSESLPECANAPSFRFQRITGITRLAEASLIDRALAAATALRNKSPPGSQAVRHPLHRLTNTKRLRACCMTLRHPSAQLAMNWPPGALSPGPRAAAKCRLAPGLLDSTRLEAWLVRWLRSQDQGRTACARLRSLHRLSGLEFRARRLRSWTADNATTTFAGSQDITRYRKKSQVSTCFASLCHRTCAPQAEARQGTLCEAPGTKTN